MSHVFGYILSSSSALKTFSASCFFPTSLASGRDEAFEKWINKMALKHV